MKTLQSIRVEEAQIVEGVSCVTIDTANTIEKKRLRMERVLNMRKN